MASIKDKKMLNDRHRFTAIVGVTSLNAWIHAITINTSGNCYKINQKYKLNAKTNCSKNEYKYSSIYKFMN